MKKQNSYKFSSNSSGFTLIEILVVLVIIGILAGYIGPKIMSRPGEAKQTKAKLQLQAIETALKLFKLDTGHYPTTEQGLEILITPPPSNKTTVQWRKGGYLEKGKVPTDPWDNAFIYLSPGEHGPFDLCSYGADRELGGEGEDSDINSWEIE